jgi:hypothetical protein
MGGAFEHNNAGSGNIQLCFFLSNSLWLAASRKWTHLQQIEQLVQFCLAVSLFNILWYTTAWCIP